ncbi:hypothetical protein RJ640_016970 [Escallonia rubra]|uniref:Fe2OG dioxygenase domain-containing protein n=1 Tax=Escallonia rubra TaxID=112253 RepID=A0AA88UHI3_9ASTE|nr:hypothetical protein RJ640_016970 [Escallonia rubra]
MVTTGVFGDLGGSLPVENVQALASKNPDDIPLQYIRPEVEYDEIFVHGSLQIPVIDMNNLVIGQVGYGEELAKLHRACKEWGFFQLINHGASEAIEHMKVVTEEFFKLPLEEKMACAQVPNNIEGYGQAFVVSEDQKLDWGDMLFILPLPASRRNMRFWPQNPASFKSTLEEYSSKLLSISRSLLGLMAENLGANPEELTSKFEDCIQGMRMNYYPPCVHADKVMGLTPHSDATGLTLLIQINEVEGLQIRKDRKWIMSNGEYSSIEHRAVVNVEKERLSIAAFHSPNVEGNIGPLPDLAEKEGAKYKTISVVDFLKLIVSRKLDGVFGDLGGSLPVENVQALASKNPEDIPLRYIRPEVESDEIFVHGSLQIPVIDMNNFVIGQVGYDEELAKLHRACKEWGFFQLINHGASEAIEHMKVVTEEFFMLPLEEKMACAQVPNNIEGYGQAFVVSEDQKLDWGDMLFVLPLPASRRNMRFWPQNPASFKSTLEEYSSKLLSISMSLLELMAENLGANPEELTSKFEDCIQGMRMNYYPPCVHADKVMGITPHSDASGLTLLIQINEVEGLQIRKDRKWVPIEPIPGAIIIMSNGEYSSIEHRAVVNVEKERLSIAAFHSPNMEANFGPLPDLAAKKGAKYKTISVEDFLKLIVSRKLDGKSLLDHLRITH